MDTDPARMERSRRFWRRVALASWVLLFAAAACDASGNWEQVGTLEILKQATVGPEKGGSHTTLTAGRIVLRDASGRELVLTPGGVQRLDAHGKPVVGPAPAPK